MIQEGLHTYTDGTTEFVGWLVQDDHAETPRPGVLIAHAFGGLGDFEKEQACKLADMGYTVLAMDYYGGGQRATSRTQAFEWIGALNADRPKLAQRMHCALDTLKNLPRVDPNRTAAIGYCYGGKAVLDLARTGGDLRVAASLHGLYDPPPGPAQPIKPAVLILHGWGDPLAPPEAVQELCAELTKNCPDWQLLAFGHTGHAFTNPTADMPDQGILYSEIATRHSWRALADFLADKLSP